MYEAYMMKAAGQGAELIVFPEFGLFSGQFTPYCVPYTNSTEWCPNLPDPRSVPCGDNTTAEIFQTLSCSSQNANIYSAVNLCARYQGMNYNTEVVFDNQGRMISFYRKMHPWESTCFAAAEEQLITFTLGSHPTEIGIFTCKDILYAEPGPALVDIGVTTFIYSAAIPLVGSLAQEGWTGLYNSTMLASNLGDGQSGIFAQGQQITSPPPSNQSAVIIGTVDL